MVVTLPVGPQRHQAAAITSLPPSGSGFWLVWQGWKPGINLTLWWCTGCPLATVNIRVFRSVSASKPPHWIHMGNRQGLLQAHCSQQCRRISKAPTQRDALLSSPTLFLLFNKASLLPKEITAIIRFISTVSAMVQHRELKMPVCPLDH